MNDDIKESLDKVIANLKAMPRDELLKLLDEHKDGEFATAMKESSEFLEKYYSDKT